MTADQLMGRSLGADEIEFSWEFSEEGVALCVLAYRPEECGGWAHPDVDERCDLEAVFVGDTDIRCLLSMKQRHDIERNALDDLRATRRKQECQEFDAAEAETEVYP